VAALNGEKKYLSAMKQRESYETWKAERNAARAELESRHGYDTKLDMHLVRLAGLSRRGLPYRACQFLPIRHY
jgi:hypothetical protein